MTSPYVAALIEHRPTGVTRTHPFTSIIAAERAQQQLEAAFPHTFELITR